MKYKTLQELTILDDFMFGAVMMDPDNCKALLERILEIPIDHVEVDKEKSLRYHPEYKGIRLDVIAKDDKGTKYDVEMQVEKTPVEKRARYYHAQMDMDLLLTGEPYDKLPDSYVIFICDYDPFNARKYRYTIDSHCKELPELTFQDGVHTIILSNRGKNPQEVPPELVNFLEYTKNATSNDDVVTDDPLINRVQQTIRQIKSSREMGERYMKLQLVLDEQRRKGRTEGREGIVFEMVRDGDLTAEKGAEKLSYSLDDFQRKMDTYFRKQKDNS